MNESLSMVWKKAWSLLPLMVVSALTACGGGGDSAPPQPSPTITAVAISAPTLNLSAGASQAITANVTGTGAFNAAVTWTLVSSSQLKAQDAGYTLTPEGEKTRVKFDMAIDLSIPMPGFLLKRTLKGGMETATDGLRKQVLKVKKG